MAEEPKENADWSEEAEAVLVATLSSIDELPNYTQQASVILNLFKHVALKEAVKSGKGNLKEELSRICGFMSLETFILPKRLEAIYDLEHGCSCRACRAVAMKNAGSYEVKATKAESKAAIEALIATLRGQ